MQTAFLYTRRIDMSDLNKEVRAAARKIHFKEHGSLYNWIRATRKIKCKKKAKSKKKCRGKINYDH